MGSALAACAGASAGAPDAPATRPPVTADMPALQRRVGESIAFGTSNPAGRRSPTRRGTGPATARQVDARGTDSPRGHEDNVGARPDRSDLDGRTLTPSRTVLAMRRGQLRRGLTGDRMTGVLVGVDVAPPADRVHTGFRSDTPGVPASPSDLRDPGRRASPRRVDARPVARSTLRRWRVTRMTATRSARPPRRIPGPRGGHGGRLLGHRFDAGDRRVRRVDDDRRGDGDGSDRRGNGHGHGHAGGHQSGLPGAPRRPAHRRRRRHPAPAGTGRSVVARRRGDRRRDRPGGHLRRGGGHEAPPQAHAGTGHGRGDPTRRRRARGRGRRRTAPRYPAAQRRRPARGGRPRARERHRRAVLHRTWPRRRRSRPAPRHAVRTRAGTGWSGARRANGGAARRGRRRHGGRSAHRGFAVRRRAVHPRGDAVRGRCLPGGPGRAQRSPRRSRPPQPVRRRRPPSPTGRRRRPMGTWRWWT